MEPENPVLDISTLRRIYTDSCRMHSVLPNSSILCSFLRAEVKKYCNELCNLEIFLDHIKDDDFLPLLDVCIAISNSEIEAVDLHNGSSCTLSGEHALSLLHCINDKLQVVDLQYSPFGKDFSSFTVRELSERGLTCQVLNLRSSFLRKLNMAGEFMRLHTLNLDFNMTLSSFQQDCFTCMPNLTSLSMCKTRISNLWTTVAALSKVSSLVELRFQKWLCCNDIGPTLASCAKKLDEQLDFGVPNSCADIEGPCMEVGEYLDISLTPGETLSNVLSLKTWATSEEDESMMEVSSDDNQNDFSSELFSDASLLDKQTNTRKKVTLTTLSSCEEESFPDAFAQPSADVALKYISCHASPVCFEKHYREYMIASLPQLKVLDNLPIRKVDRERAGATFSRYFEYLPYKRKHKESIVSILYKRELKDSRSFEAAKIRKPSHSYGNSQYFYTRSLSAAKVGSSAWPYLCPLSISDDNSGDGIRSFRPRQFEYHPSVSNLMVFGTLDGEVVVINHENGKMVSYVASLGAMNSVLGLCWLKKYPSKLIAGSDNGSLRLYDIGQICPTGAGRNSGPVSVSFDEFEQLTSVHVNSTDELFLASGYSKDVALYDINCGRRIQVFADMHKEHINVVKFSNHSQSIFATSSFDHDVKLWDLRQKPVWPCYTMSSSKGNVMVCFSPDDHYLLASAVDNEVRQLLAVDGRLHLNFDLASTGSSQNYTRSYYMNGRDYIISGSCDEHVVRVCCAQTGRRLRDISLEGTGLGTSIYVQSLRGDPYRDFNMSILAANMRLSSKSEIVKVNLLASCDDAEEFSWRHHSCPSNSLGA